MKHGLRIKSTHKTWGGATVTSDRGQYKSAGIAGVWIEKVKQYPW